MALRRIAFSLCFLLALGHVGLYMAVIDFNRSHEIQSEQLSALQLQLEARKNQVLQAQEQLIASTEKLSKYDRLEYKYNLFLKRYPDFGKIIDAVCDKSPAYGFHPDLIMGIMQIESDFKPYSVSFSGAYGLMQVHYWVWKDALRINKNRIFDISYNIDLGLKILCQYVRETGGDVHKALMLYNNGYRYNNEFYPQMVNQTAFCLNQKLDKLVTYTN